MTVRLNEQQIFILLHILEILMFFMLLCAKSLFNRLCSIENMTFNISNYFCDIPPSKILLNSIILLVLLDQ